MCFYSKKKKTVKKFTTKGIFELGIKWDEGSCRRKFEKFLDIM